MQALPGRLRVTRRPQRNVLAMVRGRACAGCCTTALRACMMGHPQCCADLCSRATRLMALVANCRQCDVPISRASCQHAQALAPTQLVWKHLPHGRATERRSRSTIRSPAGQGPTEDQLSCAARELRNRAAAGGGWRRHAGWCPFCRTLPPLAAMQLLLPTSHQVALPLTACFQRVL